jgi:DNA-binding transcriptional regulator YiaG
MTNLATVLKSEISRVARKELRAEFDEIRKALSSYRSQIAELKRQIKTLEQGLKKASRSASKAAKAPTAAQPTGKVRFSAKGLVSQRKRLGLSAVSAAKLLGVSPQSIANWESGTSRPRAAQIPAIAGLRTMGKKEVAERLAGL